MSKLFIVLLALPLGGCITEQQIMADNAECSAAFKDNPQGYMMCSMEKEQIRNNQEASRQALGMAISNAYNNNMAMRAQMYQPAPMMQSPTPTFTTCNHTPWGQVNCTSR